MGLLRILLLLLGKVLVPFAVSRRAYAVKDRVLYTGEVVPHYYFTWRLMWLWDNDEEGIAWYVADDGDPNDIPARILYSAKRNPVNNLRYVPYLSLKIDPKKVRFTGSGVDCTDERMQEVLLDPKFDYSPLVEAYDDDAIDSESFTWCGIYSNYRVHFTVKQRRFYPHLERAIKFIFREDLTIAGRYRFWIGWKIYPEDIYGVTDHRKESAGFGSQFKKIG
jgi:hypothetical protein